MIMNRFNCYIHPLLSDHWMDCRGRVQLVVSFIHCLWRRYARAIYLGLGDFFMYYYLFVYYFLMCNSSDKMQDIYLVIYYVTGLLADDAVEITS